VRRALGILAALLALAAPLWLAPAANAADVVVTLPDGRSEQVNLPQGDEDVRAEYTIRSDSGASKKEVAGYSLSWVLGRAGVNLAGFGYVEIERGDGAAIVLDNRQARNEPRYYPDGPPVVWKEGGQTRFLRPSSGEADYNAGHTFGASPLRINVRNGRVIQVTAHASAQRVKPGQRVRFRADVSRAQAGEKLTFTWQFNDGHSAEGQTVTHKFEQPGRYAVVVGVRTESDLDREVGGDAIVIVQVGKLRKKGPDRGGGGRNRDKRAPDTGPANSGQGAGPASAGDPDGGGEPDAPEAPRQRNDRRTAPGTEPVEGELLDAPATAQVVEKPSISARTGKLTEEENGFSVPGAVWGALVTAALLGAGTMRELGKLPQPKGRVNPWS